LWKGYPLFLPQDYQVITVFIYAAVISSLAASSNKSHSATTTQKAQTGNSVGRWKRTFPQDFMFQLTPGEFEILRSQIVMMETLPQNRTGKYLPYAFTEQGVAMLSGILNSDKAINMNIAIMRAFAEIRRILLQQGDIKEQLRQIQERINDHDIQLSSIYEVPIAIGRRT